MTAIDWPGLMRVGMGHLRLTPDQFWRLSPVELRIMLGAEAAMPPLTRARLEELAAAYPDAGRGKDHGGYSRASGPDTGAGGHAFGKHGDGGGL